MKQMQERLVLFDVDGTLTGRKNSAASLKQIVFSRCIETVYGIPEINYMNYPVYGQTDRGILYLVLSREGLDRESIVSRELDFVKLLSEQYGRMAASGHPEYHALPGVRSALEVLNAYPHGLATGNLELIARHKLLQAGLDGFFSFGGFGEDGIDRAGIIRAAIEKSGVFPGADIVLFGDTPNDIISGRAAGCRVGAVCTGVHSRSDLEPHLSSRDQVFESFEFLAEILEFIGDLQTA
ncbi:HAD family hydrolase [bacterium]|nr:HAD family hydrolase [candidate division CSSED10-310 bacterium]